eukprot:TRINITY_DN8169_c0_g1_i1.p1 TRINITY_DN8169_c0_g1~~TRINITY_DN8169_c0_g1_i1.p1  ORF type:complete len:380 (+),score=91.90 TRINITY_DN8169_c0_g1_i1:178-1317(+)
MAELPALPAAMKGLTRYLKVADVFETRTPAVAYYCYFFVLSEAITNHSQDASCREYLTALMTYVEQMKNSLPDDETIRSQEKGKQLVRTVATAMFEKANQQDMAGQATKTTADMYYKCASLFEIMAQFPNGAEEVAEPRKYAKSKAAHIIKCIKQGVQPTPGPIDAQGNPRTDVPPPSTSTLTGPPMDEPTVPMSSPAFPQPEAAGAYPPSQPESSAWNQVPAAEDDFEASLFSLPSPPSSAQAQPQQPAPPPAASFPPTEPNPSYPPQPANHAQQPPASTAYPVGPQSTASHQVPPQPATAAARPTITPGRKAKRTDSAASIGEIEAMAVACRPRAQQSVKEEELTITAMKYAISALQYHDTSTALDYCLKALNLLTE